MTNPTEPGIRPSDPAEMLPADLPPHLMAQLPPAYYLPTDDTPVGPDAAGRAIAHFESTRATTSPWDARSQHGGPPAGLLARAVEALRPDPDMPIARLTIDMLGPMPQGLIRTEAQIVRPGKRIEMSTAQMYVDDRLAASATVWRKRWEPGATSDPGLATDTLRDVPPSLGPQPQGYFPGIGEDWGYGNSIEWRHVDGEFGKPPEPGTPGTAQTWTRQRIPLVAGEETGPVQRMAVVADSANGISGALDFTKWMFIPPTMTLTVLRPARGPWLNLSAQTFISDSSTGLTTGRIYDAQGLSATVEQPLLVAPQR
ncbi:thioesterase family protein [Brevibacterium sp. 50QC2O2]|uniref:thioesterase family protein n=1 Tax=Brevibacterium sp. 50QC2O2 TaxID=2968459 RepID=UPI00211BF96F|nr:thioesterase family protein [Brevibacterium sp. 50QC2O2]MCQ9387075.1 thioesterase family protein [Brevibacterium sp. 50QC2O2]